ncbi:MucBP domain-containing protein [Lactococcus lactis]|nr:MucBP domain-containing protein [Lactococcus lactis]GFO78573.1 hypothetical protein LL1119B1_06290 [Lactococcus lactis]
MKRKKAFCLLVIVFMSILSNMYYINLNADATTLSQDGQLVINVKDSVDYSGIEGAYFTVVSNTDSNKSYLLETDNDGKAAISLPSGDYLIKQVGTTNNIENYTFTSIGFSQKVETGKTVTLTGYSRKIVGDYIFQNSPSVVHISQNSIFNPSALAQGIKAYKLNFQGQKESLIPNSQVYSYFNNVDTSLPGEYISIYMAAQSTLGIKTTHVLKVVVDPEVPKIGQSVTARYVDIDGNKISDDVIKSGNVGDAYTTDQKTIAGYTFKEVQGSATGAFTDQAQTVTYVYTKDPIAGGDVTAKYVDTDGNKISDDVIKSGNVGDSYTTDQKTIAGYTFKEVQGSATGTFTDQAQTVTYVYAKDPVAGGDVTAKYVDTDGNKISDDVIKSGNVGDSYTTDQKTIAGYTFKEVQGGATGTFTDQAQTVTYVYTKDPVAGGDVTAKYVDTDGNKISDDVIKSGNVGDSYTTDQKTIAGYTFKEVQGSATGTFTDQAQTVTYIYTKNNIPVNSISPQSSSNSTSRMNNTTTSNSLPRTGEQQGITVLMFILGISLIGVSLILAFFKNVKNN